ncbi:MAG: stage II sporulation protein P [Lachnospiraceae bacterium]|nr:stage II sporulation protein P [Lachnospiraceae bacterium]MBP3577983.1 stage II sporulation protein P [Lachnospiraceae bacterium]
MSIKKRNIKIEIILFACFAILFLRALPEAWKEKSKGLSSSVYAEKEDEQATGNMLVVEYATGNDTILNRQVGGIWIPTPTVPPTPLPTATPVPTYGPAPERSVKVADIVGKKYVLEDLLNVTYLKENLYIVNATTKMTETDFDAEYFISKDLSLQIPDNPEEPQILIFHTHASEGFADSRPGETEDTVVGVGTLLAEVLEEKYGYQVMHDTTVFDRKNGKDNRNFAYNDALTHLEQLLKEYPSIEVVIDLHRDAGEKRVVTVNGRQTAKVMLFNGLCRNTKGKLTYLPNDNLKDNLAFSFQMKLIGDEMYPGLMNRIFLKDYRYNMHLKERFLLVELGTEKNTVEEAKNAMEPLADVLHQVLGG